MKSLLLNVGARDIQKILASRDDVPLSEEKVGPARIGRRVRMVVLPTYSKGGG